MRLPRLFPRPVPVWTEVWIPKLGCLVIHPLCNHVEYPCYERTLKHLYLSDASTGDDPER